MAYQIDDSITPPSKLLVLAETRVFGELAAFFMGHPLLLTLPKGKGHPVMVLPGMAATDKSTFLLRRLLNRLGFAAYGWEQGVNLGGSEVLNGLEQRLNQIYNQHDEKVSLIGQSLGGVFARELARNLPSKVKQVISLGSPINGNPTASNVSRLYSKRTGWQWNEFEKQAFCQRMEPPEVPCTAIYSKSDGIVAWQTAIERNNGRTQNIEVVCSHIGMAIHPPSIKVIVDRLVQSEISWKPFKPNLLNRWCFPNTQLFPN